MICRYLIFLSLIVLTGLSSHGQVAKRERSWEKTFHVSKKDTLKVLNFLGSVTIRHGSSDNEVSVKVSFSVSSANQPEYVEFTYDNIDFRTERKGNVLALMTEMRKHKTWYNLAFSQSTDYVVTIPSWMPCYIFQSSGNIYMPKENRARCELKADMGSIHGGDFAGPLKACVSYGDLLIGGVATADITVERSTRSEIGNAQDLKLQLSYSTLSTRKINRLLADAEHSKLDISRAIDATLNLRYTNCRVEWLNTSLRCDNLQYCWLDICHLSPDFKTVDVSAHHGNLNIELPEYTSFSVKTRNTANSRITIDGFDSVLRKTGASVLQINGARGGMISFDANDYSDMSVCAEK